MSREGSFTIPKFNAVICALTIARYHSFVMASKVCFRCSLGKSDWTKVEISITLESYFLVMHCCSIVISTLASRAGRATRVRDCAMFLLELLVKQTNEHYYILILYFADLIKRRLASQNEQ